MLLFNTFRDVRSNYENLISKHLMLLFNVLIRCANDRSKRISKHLMLLFNIPRQRQSCYWFVFQNISCYCLTRSNWLVSCNLWKISKHLMLLFNQKAWNSQKGKNKFQNISCYCLTLLRKNQHYILYYFKTSHVIV